MLNENLDIDSKSIEDLFDLYEKETLIVNRRYQRKLVWSIEEKKSLISSIIKEYPIPLILFVKVDSKREILDGMQRLDAVMSFIEQKFDHNGQYFDLDSTALTKDLKDKNKIIQKIPILPRDTSTTFARYKFAVSEYLASTDNIDEVFRRINSNGKTLSNQELRSAGCLSNFSELIRKISIRLRGDTSHGDVLKLNSMPRISIGNEQLDYGVNIENHFYVTNGILTRRSIRESLDEELIANIFGYISLTDKPTSGSEQLDSFYGIKDTPYTAQQRKDIEQYIQTQGMDTLINRFIYVYETISELFSSNNIVFKQHILGENNSSKECPRYYQAVFLSFYDLLINSEMEINNSDNLIAKLKGVGADNIIKVTDGGRWAAVKRQESVEDLKAHIIRFFKESNKKVENHAWINEIDSILMNSKAEQTNYDFKQGLISLDGNHRFNNDCLKQIIATCVGINNISKNETGHVIIGICDTPKDAERIKELYQVESIENNGFYITGVDHEATRLHGSIDAYFGTIKNKINDNYQLTESLKQQILKDIKLCNYKGKHLVRFDIKSVGDVCELDGIAYLRQGNSTTKIEGFIQISSLMKNFLRES